MYAWGLKFLGLSPGYVKVGCMKMLIASTKCGKSYRFVYLFNDYCPLQKSVLCHSKYIFGNVLVKYVQKYEKSFSARKCILPYNAYILFLYFKIFIWFKYFVNICTVSRSLTYGMYFRSIL